MEKTLTLTLKDDDDELSINLDQYDIHKLCNYSKFFETMLTNFREKYMDKILIHVPNVSISENIILSMCDRQWEISSPTIIFFWLRTLQTIMCQTFLCIKPNVHLLKNLEVPAEGFKLLLDVIYSLGYDKNTLLLLSDNIPENYDLRSLDKKLIDKILEFNEQYKCKIVSGYDNGYIKIWDPEVGTLVKTINMQMDTIFYCCFFFR